MKGDCFYFFHFPQEFWSGSGSLYQGKSIRIVVGFTLPEASRRLFACCCPLLAKCILETPTSLLQYMPGLRQTGAWLSPSPMD